ncbi:hypothetical protein [Holdemanella porci]|uniref:hypothetical protein n=1 Tax=Holdemanella porci TaxID=2652276 RepID=UPI0022E8CCB8|nr:hypothetical protein [Holdemanella porci]
MNSLGMDVQDADEMQYIVASVVVKEEEEVKDASLVEVVYDFEQYDLDSFVSRVCDKALNKLRPHQFQAVHVQSSLKRMR